MVVIGIGTLIILFSIIVFIVTTSYELFYFIFNLIRTIQVLPHSFIQSETDDDTPLIAKNGAISSGNTQCNKAGIRIMVEGGNAVDAAIATELCIGVLNPYASGIGGGGIMMIHLPNGTDFGIDCREVAPLNSTRNMFTLNPNLSFRGGLSVAIPGELKCLDYAFKNYGSIKLGTGKITWARLFRSAIDYAGNGFVISPFLSEKIHNYSETILNDPGLSSIWTNGHGVLLKEGQLTFNRKLANTLEMISTSGIDYFYNYLAQTIVNEINENSGIFTVADLHNYTEIIRSPYYGTYRNYSISTSPLPFSGGLMLIQALNVLETFNLNQQNGYNPKAAHLISEAAKLSFANRIMLGDPSFHNLTTVVNQMLSKNHASEISSLISPDQVFPAIHYLDLAKNPEKTRFVIPPNDHGTTHISVVDEKRMAVSFTTSINQAWGSGIMGVNTGILYNDQMDDFSLPSPKDSIWPMDPVNFPEPGKRPLSSMTPTFIYLDDELFMVVGGSGGQRIFTGTLETILEVIDFGFNIKTSGKLPRYNNQLSPDVLIYEYFMPSDFYESLKEFGGELQKYLNPFNYINSITIQWNNGTSILEAYSDWRKDSISAGY